MAKRRGSGPNFAMSIGILCVAVGVPLLFVLSALGTSWLLDTAPYIMLLIITIAIAVYTGMTSGILWDFYECRPPMTRWIPCYGELTLMDNKYLRIGTILYVLTLIFLALSRVPYSALSFMGNQIALNFPFYMMIVAFILMFAIQVVKGIGILDCTKTIAGIWEERNHSSSGFIKRFSFLGFIPYVRVIAVYALNKPLATLVIFNDETISVSDDVGLTEE